ncbi:uncharacterized protein FOMMEDRAFT_169527 [Fomitiporia mediterranea MF3/22]|uniref:uncharacterized protein n=1 Tax=Fomitiporia mediterranea (strain MF3/22) TaxID=694068 RepID=UPI0004407EEC|nr:uncharacterized protein FOMMEDRAFT_169527 [Fomitiporia mediterranea MF3/22]EJD01397.1 hypothetical protein FOMMEDRAFT_169527 [Fomitiporia mediterranea MF3/22]
MNLSSLPSEIIDEILLFAAYKHPECARALAITSSWTKRLVERALYSTVTLVDKSQRSGFFSALGIATLPFPKDRLIIDLFRLSFNDIPALRPSQETRNRAGLITNLWLIPLARQDSYPALSLEDHIYTRLLLHLCANVRNLAMTGTTFSHFLSNKAEHFDSMMARDPATQPAGLTPYPDLTDLTLLDSTPSLIMEGQYTRSEDCVKIFKYLSHFTTYGYFHRNGLPVSIQHFPALTHVAVPLVLDNSVIHNDSERAYTSLELFEKSGGWRLLNSAEQIEMMVFLFPSDGRLNIESHLSTHRLYHDPTSLVLDANRFNRKAYALPIDGLRGLENLWLAAARGGQNLWDSAKIELHKRQSEIENGNDDKMGPFIVD